MKNKESIFENINTLGLYGLATIVTSWGALKGSALAIHFFKKGVRTEYIESVRNEARIIVEENVLRLENSLDKKFKGVKDDIQDIKNSMKTEKERSHDSIANNEGVLGLALEQIERMDKKLNEKTTINLPTPKRKG